MRSVTALLLCLTCASAVFSQRSIAQELVRFEASQPFSADKVLLRAELFKPEGDGRFPAVVLMHGCGGWQPAVQYALEGYGRQLRDQGFVVLNLDSFGPRNSSGGKMCASDRDLYRALSYRTDDAFDALRYLQRQDYVDSKNIFLMGQSNGGAVAIRAAKTATARTHEKVGETFRGIVAYYPWCGEFGGSRVALASPLLIFAGGKDDWVPARECQGIRASGAELQVTIYPDAAHSFDLDILPQKYLGKRIGNDPFATRDSQNKMVAFFIDNLTSDLRQERLARRATVVAQSGAQ